VKMEMGIGDEDRRRSLVVFHGRHCRWQVRGWQPETLVAGKEGCRGGT
jgi:hypothetical protein